MRLRVEERTEPPTLGRATTDADGRTTKCSRTPAALWRALRLVPLHMRVWRHLRAGVEPGAVLSLVHRDAHGLHTRWSRHRTDALRCAVHRAGRVAAMFGARNSCLTRSLVLSSLLYGRPNAALHIGFRPAPGGAAPPAGHAWVTVDARNVSDMGNVEEDQPAFTVARRIPLAPI